MANGSGMQINNKDIQAPMDEKGSYKFNPAPVVAKNGAGIAITAGYASITWSWPWLSKADFQWWITTLLAGAAAAEYSQAKFLDNTGTLTSYTHCIVNRPDYERMENGVFLNVTISIEAIR